MKSNAQTPVAKMAPLTYTIDASGKKLGRVAAEAAQALQGKKSVHFARNIVLNVQVVINNAGKLDISERRAAGKVYTRFTGHVGGLYETTMKEMLEKKGVGEVVKKTVDGMIPRNKLRKERMKRLTVNA
jgi:large subunit ribosomal protein L13